MSRETILLCILVLLSCVNHMLSPSVCPTLCDPKDRKAHQAPLSMGFSKQEYWSGLPFPSPGDLPDPGIEPTSPVSLTKDKTLGLGVRNLSHWTTREVTKWIWFNLKKGFPSSTSVKEHTCQCRRHKSHRLNSWVGKIPWRRKWQPTPIFLSGESHGQRSLVVYSPWGHKESDVNEET